MKINCLFHPTIFPFYCQRKKTKTKEKSLTKSLLFLSLYLFPSQLTALFSKDTLIAFVKRCFFFFFCLFRDFIVTALSSFTSTHIMLCFACCLQSDSDGEKYKSPDTRHITNLDITSLFSYLENALAVSRLSRWFTKTCITSNDTDVWFQHGAAWRFCQC